MGPQEGLESALRIVKRQTGKGFYEPIKDDSSDLAEARLMHVDQRASNRARTDR
jgi:hypothetical protein